MSKILVTGHVGFIGSHLVEALYAAGHKIIGFDNFSRGDQSFENYSEIKDKCETICSDILDVGALEIAMQDVDVVYHMAALPSHRLALLKPYEYLQIDMMGTANILEVARQMPKSPLVLLASSNKVYGKQECPWKEDKLPQPEGPYAVAKWTSEKLCEMYTKYFNVPTVVVRFHHVAGTRSNPDLALSIFVDQARDNETLEVHGRFNKDEFTSCSANYTHVDDAVRATILAVEKYKGFDIFNVANKNVTSVLDMAKIVINKLKSKSDISLVAMDKHETLEHISDVSKAEKILGFKAQIPVEKAIEDYIKWSK